jgi:hypothetical protein
MVDFLSSVGQVGNLRPIVKSASAIHNRAQDLILPHITPAGTLAFRSTV